MMDGRAAAALVHVLIVNLARRKRMRRQLGAELKHFGFENQDWIDAVDGLELAPQPPWRVANAADEIWPWSGWADPYAARALTLGEVGCTLSHVRAWRRVVELNKPCLILEDDATLISRALSNLGGVLHDLSQLEYSLCYFAQRNDAGAKPLIGRYVHLVDYHALWTLAYMVTPQGARQLLESPWQERLIPSDDLLAARFGLHHLAAVNQSYQLAPGGLVLSTNQRLFAPAPTAFTDSQTEKAPPVQEADVGVSVFTVATEDKPELQRLLQSGARYGAKIEVLGLGKKWKGGAMANNPGGGQKINLLRAALKKLPPERPVLFVDGYDVVLTRHITQALQVWERHGEPVLFAAEPFCWPEQDKADAYPPPPEDSPYRFLNSGGFIGRARDLLALMHRPVQDGDDDQAYYTAQFLAAAQKPTSASAPMQLDYKCELFQCLNGALDDVQVDEGRGALHNRRFNTAPCIIHANGPSKDWLEGDGAAVAGRRRNNYGTMDDSAMTDRAEGGA